MRYTNRSYDLLRFTSEREGELKNPRSMKKCGLILFTMGICLAVPADASIRSGQAPQTAKAFNLTSMQTGMTKDGAAFTREIFEARDGEKVYSTKTHFESSDRSVKEFDEKLKNSKKVIERGNALDKAGHTIGKRAVVLVDVGDGKIAALIIRTMGEYFAEIRSHSQQDALEFEKQFIRAPAQ